MGPSTLQKLMVSCFCPSQIGSLVHYLRHADTQLLYLELEGFCLEVNHVESILEGIRSQTRLPSTTTMTQLTLKSCAIAPNAMDQVSAFIVEQTARNSNHPYGDATMTRTPMLYVPTAGNVEYTASPEFVESGSFNPNHIRVSLSTIACASSLASSQGDYASERRHQVSLSLCSNLFDNVPAFSDALAAAAPHMGLVCLQLHHVSHTDSVRLARCLPHILSLRVLHLVDIQPDAVDTTTTMRNAMRQNVSVFTSSFIMADKALFFRDKVQRRAISAYGQRNRVLADMMLKKTVLESLLPIGTGMLDKEEHNQDSMLVLVPRVFHVTKSIPLVRSWLLLSTLLALDSSIGENDSSIGENEDSSIGEN